jgi:HEAT repeat protein
MATEAELIRLLEQVTYDPRLKVTEGFTPFRNALRADADGIVLQFLNREMPQLQGEIRGGIAFAIAEYYWLTGDVEHLRQLYYREDVDVKESVLNALTGEPGSNPQMGPAIVQLAIEGMSDDSAKVRQTACQVVQNQCAWGSEVTAAVPPLRSLLKDASEDVRYFAAYAVGKLAKGRYDMESHIAGLEANMKSGNIHLRAASAWALWQMSRFKHDIGLAIAGLARLLADRGDYNEPRKRAAGALLHHAKKSAKNAAEVKHQVKKVGLVSNYKEVRRFLKQLGELS